MKRPGIPRRAWIRRRTEPKPSPHPGGTPRTRRPIKKVNAARKAKKVAKYKAFLSSGVWKRLRKEALERAGHRCENMRAATWEGLYGGAKIRVAVRCPETEKLTVHHKTYARFGGNELPEDLEVKCKDCHDRHSALTGKRIA